MREPSEFVFKSDDVILEIASEVVVALVVVERVMLLKIFAPENALLSERSVEEADEPALALKHVPLIAKHPVVIAIPFAKVDVPVPVTARKVVVA